MSRRDIGTDDPRVRVRPGKQSRPRTKARPDYSATPTGMVFGVDRGRYAVILDTGIILNCVRARELGRRNVTIGDKVHVTGDISGHKDTLARIVTIETRRNELRRSNEDDSSNKEHVLVANADQLCIVTAAANPTPRTGFIDRCLVAALSAQMTPLLVVTKTDIGSEKNIRRAYSPLGVQVFATSLAGDPPQILGLEAIRTQLNNKITVMVGHSGVGKSTITNALVPGLCRATGQVNKVTGRGRHTSSSALASPLPAGGWVVDTPGVRSFGLAHITTDNLLKGFTDLSVLAQYCPRGCHHLTTDTQCALDDLNLATTILPTNCNLNDLQERVNSFRRLLSSRQNDGFPWHSTQTA